MISKFMWKVYTDGSSIPNPGLGGAGAILLKNNQVYMEIVHSSTVETTNNRMELYAVIMCFPHLPKNEPVTILTDSTYVSKGITIWMKQWVKNDWKNSKKQPVPNVDLWKRLKELTESYPNVKFQHVKAHDGNYWNEKADQLAKQGATSV